MALNTSPSFMSGMSGKSMTGTPMSNQAAGQRAVRRRSMSPGMSGMRPTPPSPMKPSFMSAGGGGGGVRPPSNGLSASSGLNPMFGGPSMGGPIANSPGMRMQGPPLMSAEPPPSPMMSDGMVAATAPPMEMSQGDIPGMADRLQQKMGGNSGFTGGMSRGRNMSQSY